MVNFNHLHNILIFCIFILFMTACGVYREASPPSGGIDQTLGYSVTESEKVVLSHLRSAYDEWGGAPYLLGGSTKTGVDCSAFTKTVLKDYFDKEIPRHTRAQLQAGDPVRRNAVRPGDLIFFRTNRGVLHVGIAMDNGDFLHASLSSGVMISNVSERYWAQRFLGVRRIL